MGGAAGVRRVELSSDGGTSWSDAQLGADEGRYSFRLFSAALPVTSRGHVLLMSRCTNQDSATQYLEPNWNAGGYMRGCVEPVPVRIM